MRTDLAVDTSRTIISWNRSPDVLFEHSINPYRGCEHGCILRARLHLLLRRPTHAWLGLSPGLDFERRLFYKPDAAEQLERELARPGYRPATIVCRAGKLTNAQFGTRVIDTGPIAELLRQRFELAAERLGLLQQGSGWEPDPGHFRTPRPASAQGSLFDPETGCPRLTASRK